MATFELSSKKYKNGRRPFKAVLYELQPPECVVDETGTKYNKNGITFLEEYASQALESIKDMSITASFLDEERTLLSGHGMTDIQDGMPIFDQAEVIGHFTKGYIADIEINEETKRCVCGDGYLDEMRYKSLVSVLETELENGNTIDGSIEIFKSEGNEGIVYKYGWKDKGRIPSEYIHSGYALLGVQPADSSATLLELNSEKINKEDNLIMEFDMNEVKSVIKTTITELSNKESELNTKVAELNQTISEKDTVIAEKEEKIVELNATVEQVQKALDDLKKEHEGYWAEREALEKELGELKAKARLGELNSAIEKFTDEEKKFAEVEINNFNENPMEGNVEAIVNKIYAGIGEASKKAAEEKIAEINSTKETTVEDIFSEICSETSVEENEDLDIFN